MRLLLSFLLAFWFPAISIAQKKVFNCEILRKSIERKEFSQQFFLDKYNEDITIVDTGGYFNYCQPLYVGNRKAIIYHDTCFLTKEHAIIIYNTQNYAKSSVIHFFRKCSNTSLEIEYKTKGEKVKIISALRGIF
ncbi:MAG: hypothetical protein H7257_07760 [Taibaiella sp.]|nr:hypothetical protein [Taibaiella sp.]